MGYPHLTTPSWHRGAPSQEALAGASRVRHPAHHRGNAAAQRHEWVVAVPGAAHDNNILVLLNTRDASRRAFRSHRGTAREALETDWTKLEVIADEQTLLWMPSSWSTRRNSSWRAGSLFAYTNDDPVLALRLRTPWGRRRDAARIHRHRPRHPESAQCRTDRLPGLACRWFSTLESERHRTLRSRWNSARDAVLLATAVTRAQDPVRMAQAFRHAVTRDGWPLQAGLDPEAATCARVIRDGRKVDRERAAATPTAPCRTRRATHFAGDPAIPRHPLIP
jgi:hypothetical protein